MKFLTELFPYQKAAVEKLLSLKVNALYMEQGTGKTRTTLELIGRRLDARKIDKVIWLCPCNIKETGDLVREIKRHVGYMPDFIEICGIETLSSSISTNARLRRIVQENRVYLVVDESNLVKNYYAIRTSNVVKLSEKSKYRTILNGTPVSKDEADLFAQWYILDWRILGYKSYYSFAANHLEYDERNPNRIRRVLNTSYLASKIAPYTYQILKSECVSLPSKDYITMQCGITLEQQIEYSSVLDKFLIADEMEEHTLYKMFTALQLVISGRYVAGNTVAKLRSFPMFIDPEDNPRIQTLLAAVRKFIEKGEKAIIYCKFSIEITDIVETLNKTYGVGKAVRFDGSISKKQRKANLDLFTNSAKFMVCNKVCAGYGLNLQFCHNVIYYSNDWDFATRSQSEDRVHRLGQTETVKIIDIISSLRLDERIRDCLVKKENLVSELKKEIGLKNNNLRDWLTGKEDLYDKNRTIASGEAKGN